MKTETTASKIWKFALILIGIVLLFGLAATALFPKGTPVWWFVVTIPFEILFVWMDWEMFFGKVKDGSNG